MTIPGPAARPGSPWPGDHDAEPTRAEPAVPAAAIGVGPLDAVLLAPGGGR